MVTTKKSGIDIEKAHAQLVQLVGEEVYDALMNRGACLQIWRQSTPHNYFITEGSDSGGTILWHASEEKGRRLPRMGIFEKIEDSEQKVPIYWGGDSGKPSLSTYKINKLAESHEWFVREYRAFELYAGKTQTLKGWGKTTYWARINGNFICWEYTDDTVALAYEKAKKAVRDWQEERGFNHKTYLEDAWEGLEHFCKDFGDSPFLYQKEIRARQKANGDYP
jgi:hypothetical protein